MKLRLIAVFGALFALTAFAPFVAPAYAHEGVHVSDPFARFVGPSGAAYFRITNHADADDRLISASSPDAGMVMIMTSAPDANGVMKMSDLPEGIVVPAETSHDLAPGADHVMLMAPTHKVAEGETVTLILTFEHAGEVTVTIPVLNKRQDPPGDGPTGYDAASGEGAEATPAKDPHAAHKHMTP